jgi:hypothetical protein
VDSVDSVEALRVSLGEESYMGEGPARRIEVNWSERIEI